jgi:hypothetical protein
MDWNLYKQSEAFSPCMIAQSPILVVSAVLSMSIVIIILTEIHSARALLTDIYICVVVLCGI